MNKINQILHNYNNTNNMIEKNIYITNLRYLLHTNYKEEIEKIVNQYKSKTIGDKRAADIAKKVALLIGKNLDILTVYRIPDGKYWGTYYDNKGTEYETYSKIDKMALFISVERGQDYYGTERLSVGIAFPNKTIAALYYEKKDDDYKYEVNKWEKLRYTEIDYVPTLAIQIKDLYNNSILKIRELQEEIRKQENNINCDYMRSITNNSLYIYGDYRDKLIEE